LLACNSCKGLLTVKKYLTIDNALLQAPAHTIVSNAGFDSATVLGKLLEQDDYNLGYGIILLNIIPFLLCFK